MHVTLVTIQVKPERIREFIEATRLNHEASVREPGNLRFDVLQHPQNLASFVLYEAYVSEADAARHKQTEHYAQWRDTVLPWMAEPRIGTQYLGLYPQGGTVAP